MDKFKGLLEHLRNDSALFQSGEEASKQGAVLPVLAHLGWDCYNIREVVPEYSVGDGRVDYCLKAREEPDVFIEVKRTSENLEKHQRQLLDYAFQRGVKIAILTNGLVWWFYLPLYQGSWQERKFYAIDIREQEISTAARQFVSFLNREAIKDGTAIKKAEATHKDREKKRKIHSAMPQAWRELCQEPDELLLELLVEKVEAVCGHRPDNETAAEFLADVMQGQRKKTQTVLRTDLGLGSKPRPDSYARKKPVAYIFNGRKVRVRSWRDLLCQLCTDLFRSHSSEYEKVLSKRYFDRDPSWMHAPREIGDSGIYIEANLSANATMKRCWDVMALLGYQRDDLVIELS